MGLLNRMLSYSWSPDLAERQALSIRQHTLLSRIRRDSCCRQGLWMATHPEVCLIGVSRAIWPCLCVTNYIQDHLSVALVPQLAGWLALPWAVWGVRACSRKAEWRRSSIGNGPRIATPYLIFSQISARCPPAGWMINLQAPQQLQPPVSTQTKRVPPTHLWSLSHSVCMF